MKKVVSILMVLTIFTMGVGAFADGSDAKAVPILISSPSEMTGKIMKIENENVHILTGDIIQIFEATNIEEFSKGQIVKVLMKDTDKPVTLQHYLDTSNVEFGTLGNLVQKKVMINDQVVEFDVNPQSINGKMMIPLRKTLETLGYTIKWNAETKSVEISKGVQWTSIKIGENAYFKNKMAPRPLSAAPVIVNGRTLVPAEFYHLILGFGLSIDEGNITINESEMAIHSGYIQEIKFGENERVSLVISEKEESESMNDQTIIHVSPSTTYFNTKVEEGAFINVIAPPIMTMSIPGQTSGIILY